MKKNLMLSAVLFVLFSSCYKIPVTINGSETKIKNSERRETYSIEEMFANDILSQDEADKMKLAFANNPCTVAGDCLKKIEIDERLRKLLSIAFPKRLFKVETVDARYTVDQVIKYRQRWNYPDLGPTKIAEDPGAVLGRHTKIIIITSLLPIAALHDEVEKGKGPMSGVAMPAGVAKVVNVGGVKICPPPMGCFGGGPQ